MVYQYVVSQSQSQDTRQEVIYRSTEARSGPIKCGKARLGMKIVTSKVRDNEGFWEAWNATRYAGFGRFTSTIRAAIVFTIVSEFQLARQGIGRFGSCIIYRHRPE